VFKNAWYPHKNTTVTLLELSRADVQIRAVMYRLLVLKLKLKKGKQCQDIQMFLIYTIKY
jgi:hypothetical protein